MMHPFFHRGWTLVLLMLVCGCGESTGPVIEGRVPLDPLPVYPTWYAEVEACSEATGDYEVVEWYRATSIRYEHEEAGTLPAGGVWIAPHTIVMQEGAVDYERAVKHEMLHDILQDASHSVLYGRCVP